MASFSVPVGIGPHTIQSPFTDRSKTLNPSFKRTQIGFSSNYGPFMRGTLGLTRYGLGQVPFPDPDSTDGIIKGLFNRVEMFLYTVADAAVSGSPDALTDATTTKQSDWLSGITNGMETVLKVLKGGLSAFHVPYSYGFAIILLTVLVKAATFPLTKKQVESAMAMRSLAPQIKAIQERYAGDQVVPDSVAIWSTALLLTLGCVLIFIGLERIQLETARLYKLAGINPLAGCLPTLATIPIWIGLYRALSNVADEGLLTEGFFWIPSLSGPTTIAARQTGSGTSWLFPFIDGHPPLGWSDTFAYLVLPVLLIITQYISVQIMQPPQSNDPNLKSSQAITKLLPLMIGYFALSVPSGLSLYWFTNNILSTAQQVWLQKLGGARNPLKEFNDDIVSEELSQMQKSVSEATSTKMTDKGENLTSEGLRPGERFKLLKEQEAKRRQQREEEKRRAEDAARQQVNGELKNEVDLVEPGHETEDTGNTINNDHQIINGDTPPRRVKDDTRTKYDLGSHEDETTVQQHYGTTEKEDVASSMIGGDDRYPSRDERDNKNL